MSEPAAQGAIVRTGEPANADKSGWTATGISVLGALVLTSCCILPLVLVSFGITGVFLGQMASLYQYKWITFSISAAFLAYGFWKSYRPAVVENCADGACERPINKTLMRSFLWGAAAVMSVAIVFPYISPYFLKF